MLADEPESGDWDFSRLTGIAKRVRLDKHGTLCVPTRYCVVLVLPCIHARKSCVGYEIMRRRTLAASVYQSGPRRQDPRELTRPDPQTSDLDSTTNLPTLARSSIFIATTSFPYRCCLALSNIQTTQTMDAFAIPFLTSLHLRDGRKLLYSCCVDMLLSFFLLVLR